MVCKSFLYLFVTRVIAENNFRESRLFRPIMTSRGQTVSLIQNLLTSGTLGIERTVKCFFPRLSSPYSFRDTDGFVRTKCRIGQI